MVDFNIEDLDFTIDESYDDAVQEIMDEARKLEEEGNLNKALSYWTKAVKAAPDLIGPKLHQGKVYKEMGRWKQYVDSLNDVSKHLPDDMIDEKVRLLKITVPVLRDEMKLPPKVMDAYKRILDIDPNDEETFSDLVELIEGMGRWPDLAKLYQSRLEQLEDDFEKVPLLEKIAELYDEKLRNKREAVKAYEQLFEVDPTHEGAIEHLKEIYEQSRDYESLIGLHRKEMEQMSDMDAIREKTIEIAQMANDKIKKPETLIELWEAVLEVDDENLEALEALEALYERSKDYEKMVSTCQKLLEILGDDSKKVAVCLKAAPIIQDKLENIEMATEMWRQLLELEPDNRRAQDSLKKLLAASQSWDELEALFTEWDKLEEYIRIISKEVDNVEEVADKLSLLFREAKIWRENLDKGDRAMKALEKVLTIDDTNLEAAELLIELYEENGQHKKLPEVLEIRINNTEDEYTKRERIEELASIFNEHLRDKESSFTWYIKAVALDPEKEEVRAQVEELAGDVKEGYKRLVEAYEAAYESFSSLDDALPLMHVVARAQETELDDKDNALATCKKILEIEPTNMEALNACERIYNEKQAWEDLLEVYTSKIDLIFEEEDKKELIWKKAEIYDSLLEKPEDAVTCYIQALEIVSDDLATLAQLDSLYVRLEKWEELADTLQQELDLSDAEFEAKIGFKFRWSEIQESKLENVEGAVNGYAEVLEWNSDHEGARVALEKHLKDEEAEIRRSAADILEPVYKLLGQFEDLIVVHEIQAATEEDNERRLALFLTIGQLWSESLGNTEKAFGAYSRAIKEVPDSEEARQKLEAVAELEDKWRDVFEVYETVLKSEGLDDEICKVINVRAAEIANENLEMVDRAIEHYSAGLELDPVNTEILAALEQLYKEEEKWEELLSISKKQLDLAEDMERRQMLRFRCGDLLDAKLERAKEAVEIYEEILGEEVDNVDALHALDKLYLKLEMWSELGENLTRQLELTYEPESQSLLLRRLAKLQHEQLSETELAIDTWRRALDLDGADEEVIAAMESLLSSEDYAITVAKILEPVYKNLQRWENLIRVFDIMKENSFDPMEQIELVHRISGIYEDQLEDAKNAFLYYGKAFRIDPTHEETRGHLERLAGALENWDELFALYSEKVDDPEDVEVALDLQTRIAQLLSAAVNDVERAAAAYNKLLEIKPDHVPAVEALEQLFMANGDTDRMVTSILRKVELVFDPEEKKNLAFRAAEIQLTQLEKTEDAVATYRLILEIDDTEMSALDALENIFVQAEDWDNLKDVYARKADLAPDIEERKRMLYILGQVYDEELKDLDKAIETYERIIDEDPVDDVALQRLDSLYERTEKWQALIENLEVAIQNAMSDSEVAALKLRLGTIQELKQKEIAIAVPIYGEALQLDPDNKEIISSLKRVMNGGAMPEEGEEPLEITYEAEERLAAARILDQFYSTTSEPDELAVVLDVMVSQSEDEYDKVALLHRLYEIRELQLDDAAGARDDLGRALLIEPRNERTLQEIERLSAITDSWDWLIGTYDKVVAATEDGEDKIFFQLRVARVFEEEKVDLPSATARMVAVLEIEESNWAALSGLDKLYEAQELWGELAGIIAKEIEDVPDMSLIPGFRYRLARMQVDNLDNPEKAVEAYSELLEDVPDHQEARDGLEELLRQGVLAQRVFEIIDPLYRQDANWEKVVELTEIELNFVTELEKRVELFKAMCDLHENYLADAESAFNTFARIFAETTEDRDTNERLEELAAQLALWPELVEVYREGAKRELEKSATSDEADYLRDLSVQIWLKAARVCEEELMDPAGSEECNLEVLKIDPVNYVGLESLDRIYTTNLMFPELAGILQRRADATDDTYDKLQFLFRLARLNEESIENIPAAIKALEDVLVVESDNMDALEGLERLQFNNRAWKDLYHVYERMVEAYSDDDEKAEALGRMAKIASDGLSDAVNAKSLWLKVIEIKGEDPRALSEMAFLAEQDQNWEATVDFLDRITEASYETEDQIKAYLNLGRISLDYLNDHRKAMEAYLNVRSIDPDNLEALDRLSFIYGESQAWEELVEVLERLVEAGAQTLDTQKLRDTYARIGTIEKEYLVRADNAISAYENVLRLVAGDVEALEALEILYTQGEMWTNTIRIVEEKLKIAPDATRQIELLLQIATLWENRLNGLDEAAGAYARILKINHLHKDAYENIERLYTVRERWAELNEVYLDRHEALGGNAEDLADIPADNIDEIVLGLQKLAAVTEDKMNDRKEAFSVLSLAFDIRPTNDETARRLERIADIDDTWEDLIVMYEETAEFIEDRKVKCDLLTKTGTWYCDKLDNVEKATTVLRTALKHDPNHGGVHLALAEVHKINNSISEYIEELKKALEVESRTELRYKAAMELARVHEKDFGDFHEAVRFFKVAHESEPARPEPMQALERLLAETENWRELINIMWEKVEHSEDDEEILDLKIQIAELYDDRREAPSKAVEVLTSILETTPDHLPTMRFLERLYDKIGDMEEYLALLERQMEYITNDEEMVMKYHQMAAVWEEHYEKTDKSMECYESILEINGSDETAYRNLARLYRQEKKWPEYIDVLYRHIDSTFDPKEKVRLYKAAAVVLEKQLDEPERAIDCYASIINEEEDDLEALSALSRLYEAAEDWDRSLRVSQRLVNLVEEPHDKVELYHRLGKISEDHLLNEEEAERLYAEAMAINPSYVPALRELSRIYERRGDWIKASRMLDTAQLHTANVVDKTAYLYEGGVIYLDHLEEAEKAAELFEQVLELDPEHVDTAMRYVDILWEREKYEEAFPHLQMLVRKLKAQDPERDVMVKVYYRYGKASQAKGDLDRALKAFNDAFEMEKTSLPILMGLASTYYSLEKWDDAFNKYKQILVHLQNSADDTMHTEIYYNLGNIRFKQHDIRRALNLYEKALEMDPNHVPTLNAMVDLYEHENNYKSAAEVKEQIIEATFETSDKIDLLTKLGEYQRDKVKDNKKAIDAYSAALDLDPDNTILIHELIELYQNTEQWKKVVRLMKLLAEKESDPMVRSKYYYSVAGIYRSFINSPDEAIEYYNMVLDDDHTNLKAFQYIDKLLTSRKDWKLQERNYRKMLKRVMEKDPENKGLIVTLFHALGEIYRTRIGDFTKAMQSFENAVQLSPGDQSRDEILAELYYMAGPDTYTKAISKHQEILDRNAFNMESLKYLYKLYYEMGQYDKAWCMAAALTHAKVAEAEEMGFYKQYKPARVKQLKGSFSDDIWNRFLISEDEDIFLRNILASISIPISMVKGRNFKDYGLDRRRRSERTGEGPTFEKMFFYVLDYMGVEYPELYLLGDRRGGIGHAVGLDKGQRIPLVTVGQDLLHGHRDSDLAFMIAKELTYLRPEHYLTKLVASTGEFVGLVYGAIRLVNQAFPLPGDANVLNQSAQQLAGILPQQSKEQLMGIVNKMAQMNHVPNITQYLHAIEVSSHRAGLTIVQDLDVAMGAVKSEPMLPGGMGAKQKADALFRFATSEKYFELRKAFSVRIEDN